MAKTLNQICIPAGKVINDIVDLTALERAIELSNVKYNTTFKADEDEVFISPEILVDAVAMVGCEIEQSCDLPLVLEAEQYNFMTGCNLCLNDMTSNEKKAFGMSFTSRPEPTPRLEARYENQFNMSMLVSTRKINWLGNKSYVEANLANPLLLPNYKKADGIWTKIMALEPDAPHYTGLVATKNAAATKALQTAWTAEEVLTVIDGMLALQSLTMATILDSLKYVWITSEMYDALIHSMKLKSFDLCCVGTLESQEVGGVRTEIIEYGDLKIVKYDEFTQAIRDLALVSGAWNLPNRAVLALGLPNINYTEQADFASEFHEVTGKWEASSSLTTAIVDPYPGDFYVVAY